MKLLAKSRLHSFHLKILCNFWNKWRFVDEDVRNYKNIEEEDLQTIGNAKNTPLIKVRRKAIRKSTKGEETDESLHENKVEEEEYFEQKFKYSNVVELFCASKSNTEFILSELFLHEDSMGLSAYEFINFTIMLGIFWWRVSFSLMDMPVEQAVRTTLEKIKAMSIKLKIVLSSNPSSEPNSVPSSPTNNTNFKERLEHMKDNINKADNDFQRKEETSLSLFDRLKLQHFSKLKENITKKDSFKK